MWKHKALHRSDRETPPTICPTTSTSQSLPRESWRTRARCRESRGRRDAPRAIVGFPEALDFDTTRPLRDPFQWRGEHSCRSGCSRASAAAAAGTLRRGWMGGSYKRSFQSMLDLTGRFSTECHLGHSKTTRNAPCIVSPCSELA